MMRGAPAAEASADVYLIQRVGQRRDLRIDVASVAKFA